MTEETSSSHQADAKLLEASLEVVADRADALIASFYDRLFTEYPAVRPMFPTNMSAQQDKLLGAIVALVTNYENPEALRPTLEALGAKHDSWGVRPEHYTAVAGCLLATLREYAGEAFTPEVEGAWVRAYTFAAGTMMQGAALRQSETQAA
ncbi:globin domain-containing protein [Asanoa sp. WMMD1127]|uniref:globin domain-containing protein n=1 Tax=Asanoa sp. WMMD1127 TaxID=3016107 RepID=UPI002416E881|nr:globin domain-containing protein [Asanoa sp. WMMD1127]MDG4826649.1 globin domain-containing protein [Asanoa sp. WMMD1127]